MAFNRFNDFLQSREKTRTNNKHNLTTSNKRENNGWNLADGGRPLKIGLRFTKGRNILNFCRFFRSFLKDVSFYVGRKNVYKSTLVYPFGILFG